MPSEVVQKETEINVEVKENVEKLEIKEKSPLITKMEGDEEITDKSEESIITEQSTKSENKENEEPPIEVIEYQKKRGEELLVEGKRYLIIKDFQAAVEVLSEACSLLGMAYGEIAAECAEAYFNYGCALLELSKAQINPVGLEEKDNDENEDVSVQEESVNEINTNIKTNDDTEVVPKSVSDEIEKGREENITDEVISVAEVNMTISDCKLGEEISANEDDKDDKLSGDEIEADDEKDDNLSEDEVTADDEEKKPIEETETDDINDLQLAWELLDLAKVIYKSQNTKESKLKLSDVLMKCSEVSIEDEKYETAIDDMKEALEIRRPLLPDDSRIIAETLFQLGIAQELYGSDEEAIKLLNESMLVLDNRIKNLRDLTNEDGNINYEKETAEINAIVPEIKNRIVDIRERKMAVVSALFAAVSSTNNVTNKNAGESSSTKPVSNISHLIRKRPKEGENDGTPTKIPKLEEESITVNE